VILSRALPPPHAVEHTTLTWEEVQSWFKTAFFSGAEFPVSMGSAEKLSPVAAAHRILTNAMSVLPVGLYRKEGDARYPAEDPQLEYVLKVRANERMSPSLCRKIIMSQAFWYGEGYAWIRRDSFGRVIELIPLPSEGRVIRKDEDTGHIWYDFTVDGEMKTFAPSELLIHFFDTYDGLHGRGMLSLARETIATDGAAQRYNKKFYQNGARLSGIVEVDSKLEKPGRDKIKAEFENYAVSGEETFRVAVLDRGFKFTPIGLSQSDSQFMQSRSFSAEEVSRFTGIPAYMLQSGKQSYQSNEQQWLDFVTSTLIGHTTAWDHEWTYKLLSRAQLITRHYLRSNVAALLKGDSKSRAEFLTKMVSYAIYSPDECRALEEKNPWPDHIGEKPLITKNLDSLENVLKGAKKNEGG